MLIDEITPSNEGLPDEPKNTSGGYRSAKDVIEEVRRMRREKQKEDKLLHECEEAEMTDGIVWK